MVERNTELNVLKGLYVRMNVAPAIWCIRWLEIVFIAFRAWTARFIDINSAVSRKTVISAATITVIVGRYGLDSEASCRRRPRTSACQRHCIALMCRYGCRKCARSMAYMPVNSASLHCRYECRTFPPGHLPPRTYSPGHFPRPDNFPSHLGHFPFPAAVKRKFENWY